MPNYIGLIRGAETSYDQLSPEEAQRTVESYIAWADDLEKAGKLVGSGALSASQSRVLRGGMPATDGPHTEATEVVGGFLLIEAADLDEAEKTFSDHPHLAFGPIELRRVNEDCTAG